MKNEHINDRVCLKKLDDYTKYAKDRIKTDEDENFIEYDVMFIYKRKVCGSDSYYINTKTGENVGQYVKLYKRFYDENGNFVKDGIFDEDVYEIRHYW